MATPNYGMDADMKAKQEGKYDAGLEDEVVEWIGKVSGSAKGSEDVAAWLKDGQVLCKLVNAIKPGAVAKVNTATMPFKQMENITFFMNAAREIGVPESSMFGTPDLYEEKNLGSVMGCIYTFGGVVQVQCPAFKGPHLNKPVHVKAGDVKRASLAAISQTGGLSGTVDKQGVHTHNRALGADLGGAQADAQGLDADLKAKQAAKFDVGLESEVIDWIQQVSGETRPEGTSTHEWLKDGLVLCTLANKIKPGVVKKPNTSKLAFKQMENITFFMTAARDMGVSESSMFGTPDLYEEKNMGSVVDCIYAFGGAVQVSQPGFTGPKLGKATQTGATDKKRAGGVCTDQNEAMQRTMQVDRPTDSGITRGAK